MLWRHSVNGLSGVAVKLFQQYACLKGHFFSSGSLTGCECDIKLSHVASDDGTASMVDISLKKTSLRTAAASALICTGADVLGAVIKNTVQKGDVLSVARVAGIMAAKKTATLIPLCHNVPVAHTVVEFDINKETSSILVRSKVTTVAQTGVEMEALVAVSVAALTIYDMCKSISKSIEIQCIRLEEKCGGKSGEYRR